MDNSSAANVDLTAWQLGKRAAWRRGAMAPERGGIVLDQPQQRRKDVPPR